jgi:hypothetical protein
MTILKTLKLRTKNDVRTAFANFLNQFAENSDIDIYKCLFDNEYLSTGKLGFTN